jgi:hypothetical protein
VAVIVDEMDDQGVFLLGVGRRSDVGELKRPGGAKCGGDQLSKPVPGDYSVALY